MQNPAIVRKRIGDRIRYLRQKKGLSQIELGRRGRLGISFPGKLERGSEHITLPTLCKLCDVLGVTMAELFEGVDDLSPEPKPRRKAQRGLPKSP